jgi:hypothetical protein
LYLSIPIGIDPVETNEALIGHGIGPFFLAMLLHKQCIKK